MQETKDKKQNIKQCKNQNAVLHLVALMLIAITMVSSSIGLYAWAKYTSEQQGNATAQIAKWYFNLKTGEYIQNGPQLLCLTRTDDRSHVEEGKLAPGTSGVLPIIVDTTGTETDMAYDLTITINNCPQNMVFTPQTPASTIQTVTGEGTAQSPRVRTIRIQKYVPCKPQNQNAEHDETITWNWDYETGSGSAITSNDAVDTADSGKEVTVTISAVGTEVLEEPQVRLNQMTLKSNSVELNPQGTSQIEFESIDSVYSTESITYTSNNTNVATVSNTGLITAQGPGSTTITISGRDSTKTVTVNVILPIGSNVDYTTKMNGITLNNWKLFYNDTENNQVYLIYDTVIPNSVFRENNNGSSILKDTNNETIELSFYNNYVVCMPDNSSDVNLRKKFITAMTNTSNWSELTIGTMNKGKSNEKSVTGVFAMGSPTLDLWVKSWNKRHEDIYIAKTESNMADGLQGYYVSNTHNPPTTSEYNINLYGVEDSLYFCGWNYWLASPSAGANLGVMNIWSDSLTWYFCYSANVFHFRPIVCLPYSALQ